MALYEFPKLNVLEGVGIDDSPLLHGQNVTGASDARHARSLARGLTWRVPTLATLVMDQAGQPP